MATYIQATASISPQKTFGDTTLAEEAVEYTGNRLTAIEPGYTGLIDAKAIRRMGRVIRIGAAAAAACLQEAGEKNPDAIVTGTAFGCLEDTGIFLTGLINQHEDALQPTPFIQSTPNTAGAQIALALKSHAYNNTFVHRGFSFESALLDACMLLEEDEANTVLVGSVDETTATSHAILSRFGLYRRTPVSNLHLFDEPAQKGTIAGEGAAFFLLANQPSSNTYAVLEGLDTFYKPAGIAEIEQHIQSFLSSHDISMGDISLIIMGKNGDAKGDAVYGNLASSIFNKTNTVPYKHLCGEYPTSTSFALWLAAVTLKTGTVPAITGYNGEKAKADLQRILIYNHYQNIHHSLMLVSAVDRET